MTRSITLLAALMSLGVAMATESNDYSYVSEFESDAAVARSNDGQYYMVDRQLQPLHDDSFDYLADILPGWSVTSVRKDDKSGFINTRGKIEGQMDYDMIRVVNDQLFECSRDGLSFLASTDGNAIDSQKYTRLQYIASENYFIVQQNDAYFILDKNGKRLGNKEFELILCLKDGLLVALVNKKWERITTKGESLGRVYLSNRVLYNKWGLGVLQAVRRCIIVDEDVAIIDDRFDDVLEFSDRGLFRFRIGSTMGYIDGRARELVPASQCIAGEYLDGIAVSYNTATQKYTAYDVKGHIAFDCSQIAELSDFANNCAIARPTNSNLYGLINPRGKWIIEPVYESLCISPKSPRYFQASYKGQLITVDKNGNVQH